MKKTLLQLKFILPVVAFLISAFIVFPDIILIFEQKEEMRFPDFDAATREGDNIPFQAHLKENRRHPEPPSGFNQRLDGGGRTPMPRMKVFSTKKVAVEFLYFFPAALFFLCLNLYFIQIYFARIKREKLHYLYLLLLNIFSGVLLALFYEVVLGEPHRGFPNGFVLFKSFFICLNTYLVAYLISVLAKHQKMQIENERLKNQNLEVKCASLVTQLNPHFFFNTMNSLSFLIREKESDKSLQFVHKLSELFRYMLSAGKENLVRVREEMGFLSSYIYLMNIRYEHRLRFEFEIEEKYMDLRMPVLTLQPLVENAIKHNCATDEFPLLLTIRVVDEGKYLEVMNPILPKFTLSESNGIGLKNLNDRYMMMFKKPIIISDGQGLFSVKVPLK